MEFLNRVQLRGVAGSLSTIEVGHRTQFTLDMVTEYAKRDICETTWHRVVGIIDPDTRQAQDIKRGDIVEVEGRIRQIGTTVDGCCVELFITAEKVKILKEVGDE